MANDPAVPTNASASPTPPAPRKKKLLKRLLIVGGGLIVLLLLLVALLPSLLSTGAGKSIVVGKINDQLAGRVEIDDWSLGWFSGVKMSGIKVYDDQKRLAITVNSITTELTVLKALRGNYAIGETVIDSPNLVLVELRSDGTNNLSAIAKVADVDVNKVPQGTVAAPAKVEDTAAGKVVTIDVPDVQGTLTVKNLTGAIQGGALGNTPLRIDSSDMKINVPSLAQKPVTNDIKLVVYRDPGKKGTLTLVGDVQAIFAGKWDGTEGINKLKGSQKLALANVDLGAAAPMLAASGLTAAGTANGNLDVNLAGNGGLDAKGQIDVTDAVVGGDALKGDTYRTAKLSIPVDVASAVGADGQPVLNIRRLGIESADLTSAVTGQISMAALTNLGQQKKPGSVGNLKADFAVPDLAKVAGQLPHVLALGPDVSLRSGTLAAHMEVVTAVDSARVMGNLNVTNVAGMQAGRPVTLEPIVVSYDIAPKFSESGVTGMSTDIKVESAFANAHVGGGLDKLTLTAEVSLDRARQQLGQFIDFGTVEMAGHLAVQAAMVGDLLNKQPATVGGEATLTNVRVSGIKDLQPLNVDRLRATLSGATVTPVGDAYMADVPGLGLVVGPAEAPVLLIAASATGVNSGTSEVASFNLRTLQAHLPQLQQRFGMFVEALTAQGIQLTSGFVQVSGGASYVSGKLATTRPMQAEVRGLTVARQGRAVLANETLTITANGSVASKPSTRVELTALEVKSSSDLVAVRQQGEKLLVEMKPDNTINGAGGVLFTADLARLGQASAAWSGQQPAQPIRSGRAGGQVNFTADALKGNLDIAGLTLGNLVQNESLKATFDVGSKDKFQNLVATANVDSSFAKADVRDARVSLNAPGIWEMVTNATVAVRSDNLAKVDALMKALSPPAAGPATQPSDYPLNITAGTLDTTLLITRRLDETLINIQALKVDGLTLQKANAGWSLPKPVDFKGQVLVTAATANGATTAAQIKRVVVTEFGGSLGVADLTVPQPITLTDLGAASPVVNGSVTVSGRIQSVTGLLEVLAGAAPGTVYPYIGDYTLTQALATEGSAASAKGGVTITNFRLLPAAGSNSQGFAEERINVVNDVTYDSKSTDLTLRALKVEMPATGALTVDATGVIKDTAKSRTFATPIKLKLGYDLEKLLPLVKPMLAETTQAYLDGATVQGKYVKEFSVSGSYPAGVTADQAMKGLTASGDFTVDTAVLPSVGVQMAGFSPAFTAQGGIVKVTAAKPATLNGGQLDISDAVIDMTNEKATLSLPAGKKVLSDVSLNGLLARQLGKLAFIFANTDDAKGRLTLTVNACNDAPLAIIAAPPPVRSGSRNPLESFQKMVDAPVGPTSMPTNTPGLLDADIAVTGEFGIVGGPLGKFTKDLPVAQQLASGSLDKCHISVINGVATQDIALRFSVGDIKAQGDVILATEQFRNFNIFVGPSAIGGLLGPLKGLGGVVEVPVSIKGTLSKPEWDIASSVGTYLKNNAGKFGNAPGDLGKFGENLGQDLEKLLGGKKEAPKAPANPAAPTAPNSTTQPQQSAPSDPLSGLLRGLADREKRKEQEKQEKQDRKNPR